MRLMRLVPVTLLAAALFVAGCANTVRGVKTDVENTAEAATE